MPTAIIINDFGSINGGASRVAISSAIGMAQSGWQVVFFCCVPPVDKALGHKNISVVITGQKDIATGAMLGSMITGIWNSKARRLLEQTLAGHDPAETVVHIHCFSKCLSSSITRPMAEKGFKSLLTLHDYFFACPNGGFHNYPKGQHCTKDAMSPGCFLSNCDQRSRGHKAWRLIRQMVQNRVLGNLDNLNLIAPSKYCARLISPYLKDGMKLFTLDNPVDMERTDRVDAAKNSSIACLGRLDRNKGVDILARALDMTATRGLFIGDGPLAPEISQRHEVTGWLPANKARERMSEARVLVFPSRWHEVQSLSTFEALSRGIPVIASAKCSATEYVKHGVNGFLFNPHDVSELALDLERIKNNGIASKMSENAYNGFWKNPMTGQRHVDGLIEIYQQILGNMNDKGA